MSKEMVIQRTKELKVIIKEKKRALKAAPRGSLRIGNNHGSEQFYQVVQNHGIKSETYLTKNDIETITALAQKSYDASVLKVAEEELRVLEMFLSLFPDLMPEEVFEALPPSRQKYVTPIMPTDEEYRKAWEAVPYEPGWFREDAAYYITARGERVRSKSEQLIADLLYRLGIPYRYEYPITVYVDGKPQTWRPDFTILDVKNRKEYYLEHFGMLDDANYARNAFWKMKVYEENEIYVGKNMIYSYETSRSPIDTICLEMILRRTLGLDEGA